MFIRLPITALSPIASLVSLSQESLIGPFRAPADRGRRGRGPRTRLSSYAGAAIAVRGCGTPGCEHFRCCRRPCSHWFHPGSPWWRWCRHTWPWWVFWSRGVGEGSLGGWSFQRSGLPLPGDLSGDRRRAGPLSFGRLQGRSWACIFARMLGQTTIACETTWCRRTRVAWSYESCSGRVCTDG